MADWSTSQVESALFFTSNADMAAIDTYITTAATLTPEAVSLQDQWKVWFNNLGWYEKNVSTDAFNEARNRMNAFNLANTVSETDKARVQQQIATGFTTEEAEGGNKVADSKGNFFVSPTPLIPTWIKWVGGGLAAVTLIASVVSFSAIKAYKP